MHNQRSASIETWPEETAARNGVVVAAGFGVGISVWRGRLRVEDGIGAARHSRLFHRATGGLTRLVVLGHTGYISLEAVRWLADVKAAFIQIDADGRALATFGPLGTDRPSLRRAQALAAETETGRTLSRGLVDRKLAGQVQTLTRFADLIAADEAIAAVESYRSALAHVESIDELRATEAWAAGAYWQALAQIEVRFARRDADRVPIHWRTFGGRSSPLANGPRRAANPANAVLNYLYALLEGEASLAARIVGLDPGLGVMHVDQVYRDSLASDLMEPVRPTVDMYAFELLTTRSFAARDFFETRAGVCRVTPPLTNELAASLPRWGTLIGKVAEDFATALDRSGKDTERTPITERRRAEGRPSGPRSSRPRAQAKACGCSWCGAPTAPRRRTCSAACKAFVLGQTHERFAAASSERMVRLAQEPGHPAMSDVANRRRSVTRKQQRAAERVWDVAHVERPDRQRFRDDVLPGLAALSARSIAAAVGLSVSYCAHVQRGERMPHPRHWEILRRLVDERIADENTR